MHDKKDNNKTNTFIQGLRPFSKSLPHGLKKLLKKGSYNFSNIIDNWANMVGKDLANACYPRTVKMGKEMKDGTLVLNVLHGKELEIEYEKNEIMDKLNSFFGYNCISQVTLKVVQEKIPLKKNKFPKINNIIKINENIDRVKDAQLKSSLNNFLKAYSEKNK